MQQQLFAGWLEQMSEKNLTVVEIGAGEAVPTIRRLSERVLCRHTQHQTTLIRINPFDQDSAVIETHASDVQILSDTSKATEVAANKILVKLQLGAAEALKQLSE